MHITELTKVITEKLARIELWVSGLSVKMNIEFDSAKNEKNIIERGISFELATDFDLVTAKIWPDARQDYGEERFIALGYIGGRLYSMVSTVRGDVLRNISLRKANKREVKSYEQQET